MSKPLCYFVSATGTSCGKSIITRALARAASVAGRRAAALKPMETGCAPVAADAQALARAGTPGLVLDDASLTYRALPPLSPYAVTLTTGEPAPNLSLLTEHVRAYETRCDLLLVEGAGGLLVPLDRSQTMADFALALGYPLILVALDALGVLSYTLTAAECAVARGLKLAAIVLNQVELDPSEDPSRETNARILAERLEVPVLRFPYVRGADDNALAVAAVSCGLCARLDIPQPRALR